MRLAASFLALLVLLAGAAPAVALVDAGADTESVSTAADRPALTGPPFARIDDPTVTELYIEPDPSGDARWTVSVSYALESDTDRAAFREYASAFEAGDASVGLGLSFFQTIAAESSQATGREMAIRNPSRNATVQNDTGVVSLSFTWTNFATDTDRGFVIQESVLMPDNRTWLGSLGPSQRLVVETPTGYQVTDTRFGLDNGSVVVEGPHTFREPLDISYQQTATEDPDPQSTPWALIVGALLVVGLAAVVVYARSRGSGPFGESGPPTETATDADTEAATHTAERANADAGTDAATDDADEAADRPDDSPAVDPELLSDEERVEHLLDQNGGRMKQARIVQETGWSDAKVSQLLSTMADDGRVKKLRLGRENLISLPDEES